MTQTLQTSPSGFVPGFLEAAQSYDSRRILDVLNRCQLAFGLDATVDEVLLPSMRLVGRLWETGRVDVSEEHLASSATQMWLSAVHAAQPEPTRPGVVLLTCGPRDQHTLGLDCLAALLTARGVDCRNLGASTPTRSVVAAVRSVQPVSVVVASHSARGRGAAQRTVAAVAREGVEVRYAGGAFLTEADREGMAGHYLGERLSDAADLMLVPTLV